MYGCRRPRARGTAGRGIPPRREGLCPGYPAGPRENIPGTVAPFPGGGALSMNLNFRVMTGLCHDFLY